jgi:hypothetical protein
MMSAPVEPVPPTTVGAGSTAARSSSMTSPVAVVWCRQVDNEAESPGYTTIPEEFPGHRETLDVIRVVGNLTVNVADTHDYWDPDPAQPLSYYPNLFLYPAYGGRYTCVGRMFLSTEDRPRLGMKTLVLDTAQLLSSGEFGATILRWHASMGGPRRDGGRPPPVPDPGLFPTVGEGFLFHRGSTDPVVLVASEQWEPAMQAILEMVRVLPASLVALGAILAFPYFLPAAKTDLDEFTEQVPLSLALMRVPRGEAAGDRHTKRLGAWSASHVTVRDLTEGVPAPSGKGKDVVPLVLQLIRDHNDSKLGPITQRVDLVELTRVRQHLADPDKQAGKERRKEMWRIATAMESAALLLARARGRHVPVNVETAKRAQEYVQARVPRAAALEEPAEAAVVAPGGSGTVERAITPHPPWLQRQEDNAPPSRADRVEVVPVSVSDDPSLLRSADQGSTPTPGPSKSSAPPGSAGSPARSAELLGTASATQLRADIQRDLLRFVDERLTALADTAAQKISASVQGRIGSELDARTDTKLAVARQQAAAELDRALKETESRFTRTVSAEALGAVEARYTQRISQAQETSGQELRHALVDLETRLAQRIDDSTGAAADARMAARLEQVQKQLSIDLAKAVVEAESRVQQRMVFATGAPIDARTDQRVNAARQALAQEVTKAITELEGRLNAKISQGGTQATAAQAEGAQQLQGALERRISDGIEAQNRAIAAVTTQLQQRLQEMDAKQTQQVQVQGGQIEVKVRESLQGALVQEVEKRLQSAVEPKFLEAANKAETAVQQAGTKVVAELRGEVAKTIAELKAEVQSAEEELRSGLAAQLDLHLREAADREIGVRETLEGRLQEATSIKIQELEIRRAKELKELDQRLGTLLEGRQKETQERLVGLVRDQQTRLGSAVEEKVQALEGRLTTQTEARIGEVQEALVHSTADLQVRMQSYFDTRLREAQEREREKYIELMARLKGEIDTSVPRMIDSPRFDAALRERLGHSLETLRGDAQKLVEQRVTLAEDRLRADAADGIRRLELLEQEIGEKGKDLLRLEDTIRTDLDELDRRTAILSDRLVPVVKKTWLRIAELEKASPNSADADVRIAQLKRDVAREVRRLEGEIAARTAEVRERTEAAIANQGKVWLTLIRQLSQLTDDRRALEQARATRSRSRSTRWHRSLRTTYPAWKTSPNFSPGNGAVRNARASPIHPGIRPTTPTTSASPVAAPGAPRPDELGQNARGPTDPVAVCPSRSLTFSPSSRITSRRHGSIPGE